MTSSARPRLGLAVVTCMDARIDLGPILGLVAGDAHVLRNAGGRVTDDVVRDMALSVGLGVTHVMLLQHTQCAAGIDDHVEALREDVARLGSAPGLEAVGRIKGCVYDLETGEIDELIWWQRSAQDHAQATPAKHGSATLRR